MQPPVRINHLPHVDLVTRAQQNLELAQQRLRLAQANERARLEERTAEAGRAALEAYTDFRQQFDAAERVEQECASRFNAVAEQIEMHSITRPEAEDFPTSSEVEQWEQKLATLIQQRDNARVPWDNARADLGRLRLQAIEAHKTLEGYRSKVANLEITDGGIYAHTV